MSIGAVCRHIAPFKTTDERIFQLLELFSYQFMLILIDNWTIVNEIYSINVYVYMRSFTNSTIAVEYKMEISLVKNLYKCIKLNVIFAFSIVGCYLSYNLSK